MPRTQHQQEQFRVNYPEENQQDMVAKYYIFRCEELQDSE